MENPLNTEGYPSPLHNLPVHDWAKGRYFADYLTQIAFQIWVVSKRLHSQAEKYRRRSQKQNWHSRRRVQTTYEAVRR